MIFSEPEIYNFKIYSLILLLFVFKMLIPRNFIVKVEKRNDAVKLVVMNLILTGAAVFSLIYMFSIPEFFVALFCLLEMLLYSYVEKDEKGYGLQISTMLWYMAYGSTLMHMPEKLKAHSGPGLMTMLVVIFIWFMAANYMKEREAAEKDEVEEKVEEFIMIGGQNGSKQQMEQLRHQKKSV